MDGRGGARPARRRLARTGAAEPRLRRLPAASRRRDRRLGRRLAGHDRSRQSRGAVAGDRAAARGDRVAWARARPSPPALSRARRRSRSLGRPRRRACRAPRLGCARARPRGSLGPGRAGRRAVHRPARRDPARAAGEELGRDELERLLSARGSERERVLAAADRLRREVCGDEVTYVVTRNIQYTNVCYFRCGFCAFSKGKLAENLRGPAFLVPMDEIVRRSRRGVGAGRDRGVPPGRDPPVLHRRLLRRGRLLDPRRGAGTPRPCLLGARGLAGRGDAGPLARRLPRAAARPRARLAAGHRGRDPRRRGARDHLPGQGLDRPVARGARRRAPRRAALERDDDDGARRPAASTGPTTSSGRASSRRGAAASPSSCRSRSCRWRRRSTSRASPGAGRRSARCCSCTPSLDSPCTR